MKMVQAARGGGKKLGFGGKGGKVGGVGKGKDAPSSYYAATEGHKGSRGRGGKRGGYGKRVTYCYQCGGGWCSYLCCFSYQVCCAEPGHMAAACTDKKG